MTKYFLLLTAVLLGCSANDPAVKPPSIVTADPTQITLTSATLGGTIVTDHPDLITVRGVCWAQHQNPELGKLSSKTEDGAGAGTFVSELTGLGLNKYYVRAYAKVGGQVFYGNEVVLDIGALVPTVTAKSYSADGDDAVTVDLEIDYSGADPILKKGICWNISGNPSITGSSKSEVEGDALNFVAPMGPLAQWTSYFVRGYAVTAAGVYYGNTLKVLLLPAVNFGEVTDIDGNTYKTTVIGSHTWMAENLKVTRYNDGTPLADAGSADGFKSVATGAYVAYNGTSSNVATYGYLYNGYVVTSARNVCMDGWHLPTIGEWITLAGNLGGMAEAGGRMKDAALWSSPNVAADNSSGFSALPGGSYCRVCLSNTGIFADQGTDGYWWSSTMGTFYYVTNNLAEMRTLGTGNINDGLSVRCVKD